MAQLRRAPTVGAVSTVDAEPLHVAIAVRSAAVRGALQRALEREPGIVVACAVDDWRGAVRAGRRRGTILLLDVGLLAEKGAPPLPALARMLGAPVIVLGLDEEGPALARALAKAGAAASVPTGASLEQYLEAIRSTALAA